ncbi:unnamed protein product [Periconia digitata]|uniref:Uncharacterized protein n=1 Tax=Periconia digitata TaxID=1303443 RepID=A0A9W4UQU5_9PLEO|nr:unnamed protein product [Periconia digitata]
MRGIRLLKELPNSRKEGSTLTTGAGQRNKRQVGVSAIAIEPSTQRNASPLDPVQTLQKREEEEGEGGVNRTLVTALAALLIVILLLALVVGGIYYLRKHTRSKVREIELKPSASRAGDRESSIRSSTASSDGFASKDTNTPGITLHKSPANSSTSLKRGSSSTVDEESSIGMSRDHLQTLRYEAGSPSPSIASVSSTAPLVSGSERPHDQHHLHQQQYSAQQPFAAAGHKRRISTQRRLSVQTTFRSLMVEHSSGSPLSSSTVLEAYDNSQAARASPVAKSPLKSPGFYKTPRNMD